MLPSGNLCPSVKPAPWNPLDSWALSQSEEPTPMKEVPHALPKSLLLCLFFRRPRLLSTVSRSIEPILTLTTNPSSLDPCPEHWSQSIEYSCGKGTLLDTYFCKVLSMYPCLKLCCDNCHMETFSQSYIVFQCVGNKSLGIRLQKFGTRPAKLCWPKFHS